MNATRQFEHGAHDRTDVAVAHAATQNTGGTCSMSCTELSRVASFESAHGDSQPDELVAESAIQGQRHMLMAEAFAEIPHLDDVNRHYE